MPLYQMACFLNIKLFMKQKGTANLNSLFVCLNEYGSKFVECHYIDVEKSNSSYSQHHVKNRENKINKEIKPSYFYDF